MIQQRNKSIQPVKHFYAAASHVYLWYTNDDFIKVRVLFLLTHWNSLARTVLSEEHNSLDDKPKSTKK